MAVLTTVVGTGAAPYLVRAMAHKPPAGWTESLDATAPPSLKAVVATTSRLVGVTNCSPEYHATVIAQHLPTGSSTDPVLGWMRLEPLASVLVDAAVVEILSYADAGKVHVFVLETQT